MKFFNTDLANEELVRYIKRQTESIDILICLSTQLNEMTDKLIAIADKDKTYDILREYCENVLPLKDVSRPLTVSMRSP